MSGLRIIDPKRPERAATASLWLGGLSLLVCWIPLLGLGMPVAAILAGRRGWYTANQIHARIGVALGTLATLIGLSLLCCLALSLTFFGGLDD